MAASIVTCPHCRKTFELTEALSAPLVEKIRADFEEQARRQAEAHRKALADERERVGVEARRKADEALGERMRGLEGIVEASQKALRESQRKEIEWLKLKRELEGTAETLKLEAARQLDEERARLKEEAGAKIAEEHRLKDLEKDKRIQDMLKQIEELKRKAEQGSEQAQGDVLEVEFEGRLTRQFPHDRIEPVATGTRGGDIVQRVILPSGVVCGTILWETKRTKAWSDAWVGKLKDDQRSVRADVAVLVTQAMPKGVVTFDEWDGVWVSNPACALGVATALRMHLVEIASQRKASEGQQGKMEQVYAYLSGPGFRRRMEAIVDAFTALREDLEAEKRAFQKVWAKRETQIERVLANTLGMHGELAGIIGGALQALPSVDLPALGGPDEA